MRAGSFKELTVPSPRITHLAFALSTLLAATWSAAALAAATPCDRVESSLRARDAAATVSAADACLRAGEAPDADQRGFALRARAWARFAQGDARSALADLEAAFAASPERSYEDHIDHGVYLRANGRLEDALAAFERARALDAKAGRRAPMTDYHLGVTYARMNRPADAVQAFGRALDAQPTLTMAWWRRGLAHEALGQRDAARADFAQFARRMSTLDRTAASDDDREAWRDKLKEYGIAAPAPA